MAGMKVVAVRCNERGDIDVDDLRAQREHRQSAALMITYPSTHGVFEASVKEICQIVHDHGGQVYMDGANMNAQVGLCRRVTSVLMSPPESPQDLLHSSWRRGPHGSHRCWSASVPYLPGHQVTETGGAGDRCHFSGSVWEPSILPISTLISHDGGEGLTQATR